MRVLIVIGSITQRLKSAGYRSSPVHFPFDRDPGSISHEKFTGVYSQEWTSQYTELMYHFTLYTSKTLTD